jgi:hypothetical protein
MVGKKTSLHNKIIVCYLTNVYPSRIYIDRFGGPGLKQAIDLTFLYETVKPYYGKCGQKSIDPIAFVKLMLVGHRFGDPIRKLTSDRAIIRGCQLRLDILYFLDYELGEALPWHSTLSRTRQRLPEKVFDRSAEAIMFWICADSVY